MHISFSHIGLDFEAEVTFDDDYVIFTKISVGDSDASFLLGSTLLPELEWKASYAVDEALARLDCEPSFA